MLVNISATTVYDYNCIISFEYFYAASRKLFWTLMAAATLLVTAAFVVDIAISDNNYFVFIGFGLVVLLDLVYIGLYFVYPRFAAKRAPVLGAIVHFDFYEEKINICSVGEKVRENIEIDYSCITCVKESKKYIYLFISKAQAYIVAKTGFSRGTPEALKCLLMRKGIKYSG